MGGNSLIDRLFKRESTTKEEIRQLVDEDQAKGELEASQREMIHNIFDFDRLCAEDIMTHRTEIEAVEETATIGYAAAFALEAGCSRIPVFREDLDNVQGILYVKDLLPFVGKPVPAGTRLTDYVREPLFVPESIPCGKLFATMTDKRIQMAIVVDEYGRHCRAGDHGGYSGKHCGQYYGRVRRGRGGCNPNRGAHLHL